MSHKLTTDIFIDRAIKRHGNRYNYTKSIYDGLTNKLEIICFEHGSFYQLPRPHVIGQGCPMCAKIYRPLSIKKAAKNKKTVLESKIIAPHGCKAIALTNGKYSIIDEIDYEKIRKHNWCIHKGDKHEYATSMINGKGKLMHRYILGLEDENIYADHINGNGLDNRRTNIRKCTKSQNSKNQIIRLGGTSKYKGVSWSKYHEKWIASINLNGKTKRLGQFDDEQLAAIAYDNAAIENYKEFANINFITDENGNRKFAGDIPRT